MSLFTLFSAKEEEQDDEEQANRRLSDIVTKELSFVDRAANKRRFLVLKNEDGLLDASAKGANMTVKKTTDDLSFGPDPGFEEPTDEILEKAFDLIEEVEEGFDLDKVRDEDMEEDEEEEEEEAKSRIPGSVKKAIISQTTSMLEQLMGVINAVKAAEETDEKVSNPMPEKIGKALDRVGRMLDGIQSQYPSPVAKQEINKQVQTRVIDRLSRAVTAAATALELVKDADITTEKGEFPISRDIGQRIHKAMSLLDKVITRYPSVVGAYKGTEPDEEEESSVEKAGRKISQSNLEGLKKLQDDLSAFITALAGDPNPSVTPEEPEVQAAAVDANSFDGLAGVFDGITKALEKVTENLTSVESVTKANAEAIDKLRNESPAPNSRKIEKGSRHSDAVRWPIDMNRPMDRNSVPPERYMG